MTVLTNDSTSFVTTPIAAAAGSDARMEASGLVHGAAPKENSLKLEDAARLIRETALRLWTGSKAAVWGLVQMLLNFFRWITRPFRADPKNGTGAPADGQQSAGVGDANAFGDGEAKGVVQRKAVGPHDSITSGEAPLMDSGALVPDDYLGQDEEADAPVPGLTRKVGKLAFPAGFAGNKLAGDLPLGADTVIGAMERLNEKVPNLNDVDESKLPFTAVVCLLEQCVSQLTQARAQVRALDAQISTQLVALAALGDRPADQLLAQVLASDELGGLQGAEIRRLHAKRVTCEQTAAALKGTIETSLLRAQQQGLDVTDIATRTKVEEALPDWRGRIFLPADREPPALTPAERQGLALDVDPELDIEPAEPSPERVASLKAALISNVSNDNEHEHESSRPRG